MQHLLLESTEHRLNGLRLTIIWLRGPMHVAKLLKQTVGIQFLMSALIVVNNLVRLVLACLNGHAICEILRLVILTIADMPAKHHLTHRINDYIDLRGAHLAVLVLIVEVKLRSVTIPQSVTFRR